jgi:hypothetical protein
MRLSVAPASVNLTALKILSATGYNPMRPVLGDHQCLSPAAMRIATATISRRWQGWG